MARAGEWNTMGKSQGLLSGMMADEVMTDRKTGTGLSMLWIDDA